MEIEDLRKYFGEVQNMQELLRMVAMIHDIDADGVQRLASKQIMQKLDTIFQNQDSLDNIIHSFDLSKVNEKDKKDIGFDYLKKSVSEINKGTNDAKELKSDINDILLESDNWQVVFKEKFEKWSEKNPIYSWFLIIILISILINIASDLVTNAITNTRVGLKNKPSDNADTVVVVPNNATVVIITTDSPEQHYHKVQYIDPDTGEFYEGFISKKSLKASPSQIDDVANNQP